MTVVAWNGDKMFNDARKAAKKALVKIGSDIVSNAKRRCPVGVSGVVRRGIAFGAPKEDAGKITMEIGFTPEARYGQWVEDGRPPGKRPPPGALTLWVKRIVKPVGSRVGTGRGRGRKGRRDVMFGGISSDPAVRSAEFLIGRAIGRRGIKGKHMIRQSAEHIGPFLGAEFAANFAAECGKDIPPHK